MHHAYYLSIPSWRQHAICTIYLLLCQPLFLQTAGICARQYFPQSTDLLACGAKGSLAGTDVAAAGGPKLEWGQRHGHQPDNEELLSLLQDVLLPGTRFVVVQG